MLFEVSKNNFILLANVVKGYGHPVIWQQFYRCALGKCG